MDKFNKILLFENYIYKWLFTWDAKFWKMKPFESTKTFVSYS